MMQSAHTPMSRTVPTFRFRRSISVAKYQKNKIIRDIPIKEQSQRIVVKSGGGKHGVKIGVWAPEMGRGTWSEEALFRSGSVLLVDDGDGRLVEFEHGALGDFDDHGVFLHVVDDAVDAGGGDHLVAGLQRGDAGGHFLALLLLRADQQEIEHHDHQAHHDERAAKNPSRAWQERGWLGRGWRLMNASVGCHNESDRV